MIKEGYNMKIAFLLKSFFLCLGLTIFSLGTFAQLNQGKPQTVTSGTLTVKITPSNPCGGVAATNGFIKFDIIASSGNALIQIFGPVSQVAQVPVAQGNSFTHNAGNTLPAGTYNFIIVDSGTGSINSFTTSPPAVTLTSLASISLSTDGASNLANSSCASPNGQIVTTITGGSATNPGLAGGGSFQYTFKKGGVTVTTGTITSPYQLTFPNLSGGNYTLDVDDDYSTCGGTANWTITDPVISITTSQTNPLCNGATTGAGTFTASGGTAPYTFTIASNTTGGTTSTTATTLDLTGAGAGSISIQATDANGCSSNSTITITEPSALLLSKTSDISLLCFGDTSGTGTFTASGGTPGYTFAVLSNTTGGTVIINATTVVLSGGGAGAITVEVTDANSCKSTATISITQPASALSLSKTADVSLLCFGDTSGTGTFTASGGTLGYTFAVLSNTTGGTATINATTVVLSGGGAGSITVEVTDANSCKSTATISITQPASALSLSKTSDVSLLCFGDTSGTGTFTASGGTPGYTFSVLSNTTGGTTTTTATTLDFTGAGVGSIAVQVKDANNCTSTATISITQPASALALSKTSDQVLCFGATNGTGTFTASGGTSPYTFTVTGNTTGGTTATTATTLDFTGAGVGSIAVQVKDANNCTSTATITITVVSPPSNSLAVTAASTPLCVGGTTTIDVANSQTGVSYQLRNGGTPIGTPVVGNGSTINLSTGVLNTTTTFNVLASIGSCSASLTSTPTVTVLLATDPLCAGSCPALTTSNTTICPAGGNVDLTTLVSASVGGGTFTFTGTGVTGNTFNPSGSAGTVVAISVTYTLSGCPNATGTINVTVRSASDPLCSGGGTGTCATVVIVPKPSPATCTISNGKIVMSIKPFVPAVNNVGVQIDIKGISTTNNTIARTNFNDSTFVNLPVGVYTYTIVYGDAACTKTGQVTIDQSGTVGTPSASNIVSPKCFGQASGAVTISVPGETGNVLQWSLDGGIKDPFKAFTAGSQITGIPAGAAPKFQQVISVRRNSSDPCFAAVTITIPLGASDIIAPTTVTNATCSNNDGSILVGTISGGTVPYAFKFDGVGIASLPANNTFAGLASGKHSLTVTDANGCSKDFESNITFPGLVDFSVIGTSSSCVATSNGTVTAIISSVGSFKIGISTSQSVKPTTMFDVTSGGSTSYVFDKLPPASYFVFLNSVGSQCQNIKQQDVTSAVQDITISYSTEAACSGANGSLVIKSVGGGATSSYTYSLDGVSFINLPANNTFTGLTAGGHVFRVIDAGGCSKEFAIQVPAPTSVDFTLKNDPLKCIEERAAVTLSNFKGASVDYTYQILQQTNIVSSGLISTVNAKQDFIIKDLTLAQGNYQLQLQQNQVSINGCTSPILAVKPFTITGPSKKLDTVYVVKNISLPDLATGSVAVGITESGQDPYEVRVDLAKPLFSSQGYFQDWTKAVRNSENLKLEVQARNLFAGEYLVSVRDGFGCVKDFTFTIKADESIFIPNVITPNGDEFNDTFFIRNLPSSTQVIIVNRWGKEVYKSDDYKNNWDAKDITEGVYYYRIKAGEQVFTGWVEVLRDSK